MTLGTCKVYWHGSHIAIRSFLKSDALGICHSFSVQYKIVTENSGLEDRPDS